VAPRIRLNALENRKIACSVGDLNPVMQHVKPVGIAIELSSFPSVLHTHTHTRARIYVQGVTKRAVNLRVSPQELKVLSWLW
jgi:hypothetical protein